MILTGITFLLGATLGASGAFVGDAYADTCRKGAFTHPANSCAIGFDASWGNKDFYAWDDQQMKSSGQMTYITGCSNAKLLDDVRAGDRMTRIQCADGSYWINLDSLSCNTHNASSEPPRKELLACEHCSRLRNGIGSVLGEQVDRLQRDKQKIVDNFGLQLLKRAEHSASNVQKGIESDRRALSEYYQEVSDVIGQPQNGQKYLEDAYANLSKLQAQVEEHFGSDCSGRVPHSKTRIPYDNEALTRAISACHLIQDSVAAARALKDSNEAGISKYDPKHLIDSLNQKLISDMAETNPDMKILDAWFRFKSGNSDGGLEDELLRNYREQKGDFALPSQYDDLVIRMVAFYGLPEKTRNEFLSRGELINYQRVPGLVDSAQKTPVVLHNGYVYGGARVLGKADSSAFDCSDFIASVMRGDRRALAPTTMLFKDVARYLSGERIRLTSTERPWASCFDAVQLRKGEEPQAGDIVVSRDLSGKEGHIIFVKSYDPQTGNVRTIEATGSKRNTVGEFSRPLFEPACYSMQPVASRPVRADIDILRIRANPGKECPFRPDPN